LHHVCLQVGSILINLGTVRRNAAYLQRKHTALKKQLRGSNSLQDTAYRAKQPLAGIQQQLKSCQQAIHTGRATAALLTLQPQLHKAAQQQHRLQPLHGSNSMQATVYRASQLLAGTMHVSH
jgi:hypothetical protein